MRNDVVVFEPIPFENVEDAFTALRNGEIDCVFPVNLSSYKAEKLGILKTEPIMQTEVYAAVKSDKRHLFTTDGEVSVAMTETDRNFRTFVQEYYPEWSESLFESREACLEAVASGEAHCALLCNYELGRLDDTLDEKGLTAISTGQPISLGFAVDSHADCLYSILNKTAMYVPDSAINSALVSYSYDEKVFIIVDFLKEHMVSLLSASGAVLMLILLLLIKSLRSERKAKKSLRALKESLGREKKQQKELDATKSKAYTDPLTGVKSKNAYAEASEALQRSVVNGEKPEFAIIVFDVNDLKKVNDFYGHDADDRHILSANKMICDGFKHSPVYRIGGDEFVVILTGEDYENGIELLQSFDRQVENNLRNGLTVVSAGYARFDPESDASFSDVFKRADEKMYQRKRYLKGDRARIFPSEPSANASLVYDSRTDSTVSPESSISCEQKETHNTDENTVTIACGGVQIHADSHVASDKLNALIDVLRS